VYRTRSPFFLNHTSETSLTKFNDSMKPPIISSSTKIILQEMDAAITQKLHEVFQFFSSSPDGVDGVHFARLCRDLNLELVCNHGISSVPASSFDLIFARAKSRTRRRLDFNQFLIALDFIGQSLSLSIDEIIKAVCTIKTEEQLPGPPGASACLNKGPEKFYYDKATYTGTHKFKTQVKSSNDETATSRPIELKEIVNRDGGDQWMGPRTPRTRMSARRASTAPQNLIGDHTPLRGPARFFYDKSTYTGVHKFSTPGRESTDAAGFGKENTSPSPRRARNSTTVGSASKPKRAAPSLPDTAAVSIASTPYMTSSVPALLTPDEFLAAELKVMPLDNYFSSFLRRPLQPGI
jgi:hypothetical protein